VNDTSHTIAPKPLGRLKLSALFIVCAFLLLATAGVLPHYESFLRRAAVFAAIISLGCFIASAVAVFSYVTARLRERYPTKVARTKVVVGFVLIFVAGAFAIGLSVNGLLTEQAPFIGRRAGSIGKADDPFYFWASTVFHFLLGVLLVSGGIYGFILKRRSGP